MDYFRAARPGRQQLLEDAPPLGFNKSIRLLRGDRVDGGHGGGMRAARGGDG